MPSAAEKQMRSYGSTPMKEADYPWDQCMSDQTKKYGKDSAKKICGSIKAKFGKS